MKLLRKGSKMLVRTTFAEDERLMPAGAFESELVLRYSLDKQGYSLIWFEDEAARVTWILSYSQELSQNTTAKSALV